MNSLATYMRQFTHKIELLPTPFLQSTLECSLESSALAMLTLVHHIIFVFPAFTLRLLFHPRNRLITFLISTTTSFQMAANMTVKLKKVQISPTKQQPKFWYTNLLTSFHNAIKYGTILDRSLSTLRCLGMGIPHKCNLEVERKLLSK